VATILQQTAITGLSLLGVPIHRVASHYANRTPIKEMIDQDLIGRRVLVPVTSAVLLCASDDNDDPDP
jgi:hypothetical protein